MTRFVVAFHNHNIEFSSRHRPKKIPCEGRQCFTSNTIEDEYHFILKSSIYTNIWQQYV